MEGDTFLLEEQHEKFVAAKKWEMLPATNARWKWAAVKKSERKHVRHFLIKRVTKEYVRIFWKFHVIVVQNNGKEMYIN